MKLRLLFLFVALTAVWLQSWAQIRYEQWLDGNRTSVHWGNLILGEQTFQVDVASMPYPGLHFLNILPYDESGEPGVWQCIAFLMPEYWPGTNDATQVEYWVTGYDQQPHRQPYVGTAVTLDIDASSYSPGMHFFNYRTLNARGEGDTWKVIPFLVPEGWPATNDATLIEYWVTGYEQQPHRQPYAGTAVTLNIDASRYSPGMHFFNYRTINSRGEGGAWKSIPFMIPEGWPGTDEGTLIEYWVTGYDQQPHRLPFAGGELKFNIDISKMSYGLHFFNYRTLNELGEGGAWKQIPFYINNGIFDDEFISYEYWIDEQDTIMAAAVCPGVLQLEIDMAELSVGMHTLYFRANNWTGLYGETYSYEFEVVEDWDAIPSVCGKDEPFDVYTIDGKIVRRQVTTLMGLPKGVYIFKGRKQVVK
jgi:hypothetical protein